MTPTQTHPISASLDIYKIARICHQANKAYCETIGDNSQRDWEVAYEWQRDSIIRGVIYALQNPYAGAAAQHEAWLRNKIAEGWRWGEVKDSRKKTHPSLISYKDLPVEQRFKDFLFLAIVQSFREHAGGAAGAAGAVKIQEPIKG